MGKGWIKLHRQIMDNPLYGSERFCRSMAFIDLLLMANHDDKEIVFDGNFITLKRGEILTSLRKLEHRWKWSTTKIRKFFTVISKQNMITVSYNKKNTLITVVKYSDYQGSEHTENTQETHRSNDEVTQKNTNKNVKNEKNEKKINIYDDPFSRIYDECDKNEIKNLITGEISLRFFLEHLTEQEITACIHRSAGKDVKYLLAVLETTKEEKKKMKPFPAKPKLTGRAFAEERKKQLDIHHEENHDEPLSKEELEELKRMAEEFDRRRNN